MKEYVEIVNERGERRTVELLAMDGHFATVQDEDFVYVIRVNRVTDWRTS